LPDFGLGPVEGVLRSDEVRTFLGAKLKKKLYEKKYGGSG
jgi:hypothetical protein